MITPKASNNRNSASEASVIAGDLKITGELDCTGDVLLNGRVKGVVRCRELTIGPGGRLNGQVLADRIVIGGLLEGEADVRSVSLRKTAVVNGKIRYDSLEVEDGARMEGEYQHRSKTAAANGQKANGAAPGKTDKDGADKDNKKLLSGVAGG